MEDTVVNRAAVADVVETVMGPTAKAAEMRRRVREIKEVMEVSWREEGGSSRMALGEFLTAMKLR
uniref:Uncharacterized protein n=1 Tax=Arundo donax TaxID=35708 RepID=A0A0A9F5N5_ARUDO